MTESLLIFYQFLKRDIFVVRKQFMQIFINFGLIYPLMTAFCFCYLQPRFMFGATYQYLGTTTYIGMILSFLLIVSFEKTIDTLFDLLGPGYIYYQSTILSPRLIIIERLLFATLFTFILSIPFLPLAQFLFPSSFYVPHASWLNYYWILFLGSLTTSAYFLCAALLLQNAHSITKLWVRYTEFLIIFGGMWIPWHVIAHASPHLGIIACGNPFLYITEGARSALLQSPLFFSISTCSYILIFSTICFTIISFIALQKRIDHI